LLASAAARMTDKEVNKMQNKTKTIEMKNEMNGKTKEIEMQKENAKKGYCLHTWE
jgi:hypothetical protein